MRKFVLIVTAAVATAAPAVALASGSSAQNSAEKQCRTERTHMGTATFKSTFGTGKSRKNAFGQCVSHRTQQNKSDEGQAQTSAENTCRMEQSESASAFSMAHSNTTKTFDQFYGTNHNDNNAFGKCVSEHASATAAAKETQQVTSEVSAAKSCSTMRSTDATTFGAKFGTKSNAFGKCVSQTAHQLEQQSSS